MKYLRGRQGGVSRRSLANLHNFSREHQPSHQAGIYTISPRRKLRATRGTRRKIYIDFQRSTKSGYESYQSKLHNPERKFESEQFSVISEQITEQGRGVGQGSCMQFLSFLQSEWEGMAGKDNYSKIMGQLQSRQEGLVGHISVVSEMVEEQVGWEILQEAQNGSASRTTFVQFCVMNILILPRKIASRPHKFKFFCLDYN